MTLPRLATAALVAAVALGCAGAPPTAAGDEDKATTKKKGTSTSKKPASAAPKGSPAPRATPAPRLTPTPRPSPGASGAGGGTGGGTGGASASPGPAGSASPTGGHAGGDGRPATIIYAEAFEAVVLAGGQPGRRKDGVGAAAIIGRPIRPAGMVVERVAGQPPLLLFSDPTGDQIRAVALDTGAVTRVAGTSDDAGVQRPLGQPAGLALDADPARNQLIIPETTKNALSRQPRPATPGEAPGSVTGFAGAQPQDDPYRDGNGLVDGDAPMATFRGPTGCVVAGSTLYVADTLQHTVRAVTLERPYPVAFLAGGKGASGPALPDVDRAAARFNEPMGLALATIGGVATLLVADYENHCIRAIDLSGPAGRVSIFAGRPGTLGAHDGPAADARFDHPCALAVDPAGNVYVGEMSTPRLRRIAPDGMVTTLSGGAAAGSAVGARDKAAYQAIVGIAILSTTETATDLVVFDQGPPAGDAAAAGPRLVRLRVAN